MPHRFAAVVTACVGLCIPSLAGATTVVVDANISLVAGGGPPLSGDYELTVQQDAAGTDPTSVFLDFDGTSVDFIDGNIDEGSDWYLVDAGDPFSEAKIDAGLFTPLFVNIVSSGPVPVGPGSFFMGVSTGQGFTDFPDPNRDVFGWIELSISGTDLTDAGNAVAYGAKGIFVGTNIPIPEPSTALLLASALAALTVGRGLDPGGRSEPR